MAFIYSSKYYETVHFVYELPKFSCTSIFIALKCFDNFFCPCGIDMLVVDSYYSWTTDFMHSVC